MGGIEVGLMVIGGMVVAGVGGFAVFGFVVRGCELGYAAVRKWRGRRE